jgi:hypothetical protein
VSYFDNPDYVVAGVGAGCGIGKGGGLVSDGTGCAGRVPGSGRPDRRSNRDRQASGYVEQGITINAPAPAVIRTPWKRCHKQRSIT